MMFGTVPPVPVATFGDQQLLPGDLALRRRNAMRVAVIVIARFSQQVPGAVVFRRPDPDIEVGVDPRPGYQPPQVTEVARLVARDGLADGHRLNLVVMLQGIVEAAQEFAPRLGVILPRIFAVENNRYNSAFPFL